MFVRHYLISDLYLLRCPDDRCVLMFAGVLLISQFPGEVIHPAGGVASSRAATAHVADGDAAAVALPKDSISNGDVPGMGSGTSGCCSAKQPKSVCRACVCRV